MKNEAGLFEVIHSMRAMRRLKQDPVPDELVHEILRAGASAPNDGNRQHWRFLVVKDPEPKKQVQAYYRKALDQVIGPVYRASAPPSGVTQEQYDRQIDAVTYLTDHFHEAPVWIVACLNEGAMAATQSASASIYPAVQNMLLAARALGLGATLTTRHLWFKDEVEKILGLPEGINSYAILPIGYPMAGSVVWGEGRSPRLCISTVGELPFRASPSSEGLLDRGRPLG